MRMIDRPLGKASIVGLLTIAVTVLHGVTPAGPHAWHWAHLVAQKLYYVPLLLAAAWFTWRGALLATAAVSLLYLGHVLRDWQGYPMIQAEQSASVATFWLVSLIASFLFARVRSALSEVRSAHDETLTALASSLELRERYTAGHSERVRSYTLLLAEQLGVRDESTLAQFAAGALFHDIGKIGIPDAILLKDSSLEPDEWRVMKSHPDLGGALVGKVRFLAATRELVQSHHERFDGTGYPRGLRAEDIPLGARLFAVADTFDAMTTTRTYRSALAFEEAVQAIREGSGHQFDPRVVEAFLSVPFESWAASAAEFGVLLRHAPAPQAAGYGDQVGEGRR
jgi:hypothetical protein